MRFICSFIVLVLATCTFSQGYAQETPPDIVVTPISHNFERVDVGEFSDRSFSIENAGGEPLVVFGLSIDGPGEDSYAISGNTAGFVVNAGQIRLVTVRFQPDSFGDKEASLLIDSNDPDENMFEISLFGTGTGLPQIALDSVSYDFGAVDVGFIDSLLITIQNTGVVDLLVDSLAFSGVNSADFFTKATGLPIVIATGEPKVIEVFFIPSDSGLRQAELEVFSNDPDQPISTAAILGEGRSPIIAVQDSLIFGEVMAGFDKTVSLVFKNSGTGVLKIDSLEIRGERGRRFSTDVETIFPILVEVMDSMFIDITYDPLGEGVQEANAYIYNNDPNHPVRVVPIKAASRRITIQYADDVVLGEDMNLMINVIPGFEPDVKEFFYRSAGAISYRTGEITGNSPIYEALIPGIEVQAQGVQYYIRLGIGNQRNTRFPFIENPQRDPFFQQAKIPIMEAPDSGIPRVYRMVSIPAQLNDNRLSEVLEDNYGPYNPRRWRLFRWEEEGAYTEYPDLSESFGTGMGFWLVTNDGAPFDIQNAISTDSSEPYELLLKPGWNQIGNPFAYPVEWPAETADPRVEEPVGFDGTEFQYGVTRLQPWAGYFVRNLSEDTLSVSIAPVSDGTAKQISQNESKPAFEIKLSPVSSNLEIPGVSSRIGIHSNATNEFDRFDHTMPPPLGPFVRLAPHEQDLLYAVNFKPPMDEGLFWDLLLDGTETGSTVTVDLSMDGALPDGHQVYLLDLEKEISVNVKNGQFTLTLEDGSRSQMYRLLVGTENFALNHNEGISLYPEPYILEQNFPNPFRESTQISFTLEEKTHVALNIYDPLGRRVTTLVDAFLDPGAHTVQWNGFSDAGHAVASGVYIFQILSSEFTATKRMTLVR